MILARVVQWHWQRPITLSGNHVGNGALAQNTIVKHLTLWGNNTIDETLKQS